MNDDLTIATEPAPAPGALETLYRQAFPDEDLVPLIRSLSGDRDRVRFLTARKAGVLVGHVAFTLCTIADTAQKAALLAPLAVLPNHQGKGIGRALVDAGTATMRQEDVSAIFVLGDPALYGRFGFTTERDVAPPYDLPAEWDGAWQSQMLDASKGHSNGRIRLPGYWMKPALWLP